MSEHGSLDRLLWTSPGVFDPSPSSPPMAPEDDRDAAWPSLVWLRTRLDHANSDIIDRWTSAAARCGIAVAIRRRLLDPPGRDAELPARHASLHWLHYTPDHRELGGDDFVGIHGVVVHLGGSASGDGRRLPPDVRDPESLAPKIDQLRQLVQPDARIVVSLPAESLAADLPPNLGLDWDGLLVRADQTAYSGLPIAAMVRHVRRQLDAAGHASLPFGISPPPGPVDAAGKLIGLGATFVVIDRDMDRVVGGEVPAAVRGDRAADFEDAVRDRLGQTLQSATAARRRMRRLATTDPSWAQTLGLPYAGIGRTNA